MNEEEKLEEIRTFEEWEKKADMIYDYPMVYPESFMSVIPDWKRDREEKDREIERAYQVLNSLGVPRERAGSVANGIMVREQRLCRQIRCQKTAFADAEARIRELEEGLRKLAGDGEDEWWAQEIHRLLEKKG